VSLLAPSLMQRLRRMRLIAGDAVARGGTGERRSRSKGEGIEFEDHRRYDVGDDFRRLDPHLYARLGEPFVRQFNVMKPLDVTLLVDASGSMSVGVPSKIEAARALSSGLCYVALSASDSVQIGILRHHLADWRPQSTSVGHHPDIEGWLRRFEPAGETDLAAAMDTVTPRLKAGGLTILISDLWSDGVEDAIKTLSRAGQSVLVLNVLAPEEIAPLATNGLVRLVDRETGNEVELAIGAEQVRYYREQFAQWTNHLRSCTLAVRGRFVQISSTIKMDEVFTRLLPSAGVLR
jgi:uncharacterized protein (DUF58 family)